ncbi:MAG: SAM-dependent methyltransferase [Archangium sp.]|nr:SAM-dependent methyltransferase [Archangium sp.]MDP3156118.1 SAM-dependent methyltransferase [Archangium sp.]MDP3571455.1 SAM-dependent methyltransferase [Archangium sp.]
MNPKARESVPAKQVRRELLPNQSVELLKTLHLVTRDGQLNADARRKLKQVNHLVGLLQPALDDVLERFPQATVVDVGSGNSYLGFILYELFLKERGELLSVESRDELTEKAKQRAAELNYGRMKFATSNIEAAAYPERINVLTALHACDTATDDALAVAISRKADHVAVVPCCQAEVAQQLKDARPKVDSAMQSLFSHPWHRREFGSHLTNVIRALVLEASGYQVTVTELAGWEHSLKNELIIGRRVQHENGIAKKRLEALLASTGVRPKLVRTLGIA